MNGKSKVSLIPVKDNSGVSKVKEGGLYIVDIDGVKTIVVAKEYLGEGFRNCKIANTTTQKVLKESVMLVPVVTLESDQLAPGVSRITAAQIRDKQYPIAINCLDGRVVDFKIEDDGAHITNYSRNEEPKKSDDFISGHNSSVIEAAVQAERKRCLEVIAHVQSEVLKGMTEMGESNIIKRHVQVAFDIASDKVENGIKSSLVPKVLEQLFKRNGIKSNKDKNEVVLDILTKFANEMGVDLR